ncbi:MAG: metal ABC transporter permease [Verrucomicrobia bacterium]|nr:metal ABC transporter permease [Verrucomicrobiota bacterium]
METLREIFDPEFLLRNSVYIMLLVGFAAPLVGVYLILRRLIFLGVALPQISSCGIAFAFALPGWGLIPHMHDRVEERALALAGSVVFTLLAIFFLAVFERRGRGLVEGRIGTAYVLAGAWSILLLVQNPHGEHGMLELLRGEVISVSNLDMGLTAVVFAIVVTALFIFQKEFLLVSFDREMALTLKKKIFFWDAFLFTMVALTVSISVLTVGPLVTFGFLLLPPLITYQFARTMRQFILGASLVGGISGMIGFVIAYKWDLPVGPTAIAFLGVIFGVAFCVRKLIQKR